MSDTDSLQQNLHDFRQRSQKLKQLAEVLKEEKELDSLAQELRDNEIFVAEHDAVKELSNKIKRDFAAQRSSLHRSKPSRVPVGADVIVISDDEGEETCIGTSPKIKRFKRAIEVTSE
ncbi:hypothetical protein CALCODRAFT_488013 [Calocera cornea HHB12733]|uniref:Uncharacterized protein n=1 Tax=Calocera cornea HHB12733 TaxID=1353952 RepID=A0A165CSM8_9BASI|nr:hypothetical protein CALCODRAFT_488013 [Calocera cornea HHB12733]